MHLRLFGCTQNIVNVPGGDSSSWLTLLTLVRKRQEPKGGRDKLAEKHNEKSAGVRTVRAHYYGIM